MGKPIAGFLDDKIEAKFSNIRRNLSLEVILHRGNIVLFTLLVLGAVVLAAEQSSVSAPAQEPGANQASPPAPAQPPGSAPVRVARPSAYPVRPPADPAVVARGHQIFSANCSFCHGSDARGGEGGPNLIRSQLVMDDNNGELIATVVQNGRPIRACRNLISRRKKSRPSRLSFTACRSAAAPQRPAR